jgi:hypothetical protein
MNMEITKYKNISHNDLMENRLSKLENQIQNLTRYDSYVSSSNRMSANNFGTTNIQNHIRGTLNLSDGQMAAQMATSMSRFNQRNC